MSAVEHQLLTFIMGLNVIRNWGDLKIAGKMHVIVVAELYILMSIKKCLQFVSAVYLAYFWSYPFFGNYLRLVLMIYCVSIYSVWEYSLEIVYTALFICWAFTETPILFCTVTSPVFSTFSQSFVITYWSW